MLTPSVQSDAFWRRRYCFCRGTLRMKSENRLSKGRCCMGRSAEDGSFTPWLSQIDNVTRLYQTGKLWCHLGREQSDHPWASLWNNRTNVTSSGWQTLMLLRDCCHGWWSHIKLTYCIFFRVCQQICNILQFLRNLIYTALLMHRTHKKKKWINSYNTCTT